MAEVLSPGGMMMAGGDGGLGFGGGGGLIGGLILGSLLRQGRGGLFGGEDGGAVVAPGAQATANMQLMQSIGQVDKAVAVGTAAMEASQANQTIGLTNQFNATTGSLATRVEGVKDVVNSNSVALMQQLNTVNTNLLTGFNQTQQVVQNDGDKTRALITQQYEATETLGDALYSLQRLSDIVNDIFDQIELPVLKQKENLPSGFASNAAPLYVLLLTNNINYSDNKY